MEDRIIDYTADRGSVEVVDFDEASSTVKVSVITSIVNQGQAVKSGGKTGQVYTKQSDEDYDADWEDNLATGVEGIKGVAEKDYSQGFYEITPEKIGLGNVNNTADTDKPVSTEQAAAIQAVDSKIANHLIDTSNPHNVVKSQIGLGNVDNTADIDKPVSSAQAAALQALQKDVNTKITDIKSLIPNQASSENQLADKDFVNSSVQNMAAFYITKNEAGDPFATQSELLSGPYYFQGDVVTPTIADYAIVLKDESQPKDSLGQYPTTRYTYDGKKWVFQYIVNNTPLTSEQVAAINSGVTKEVVDKAKAATHFKDIADFTISVNDWVSDDNIKPFRFKATKSITTTTSVDEDAIMGVSFDDIIKSVGIAVASITGTSVFTIVFYSASLPSVDVFGTLGGTL